MRILIFDNDLKYAEYMKEMLVKLRPGAAVPLVNASGAEFAEITESRESTVVFVDTKFKPVNSNFIRFARRLRDMNEACHICFISDCPSDMAFCLKRLIRPSGFFLKPVDEDELESFIAEVEEYEKNRKTDISVPDIIVKDKGVTKLLRAGDVLYFTSVDKKIFCYTVNEEISFYGTLGKIEKDYGKYLLRCHNGFLVNKSKIESVSKSTMILRVRGSNTNIPVSKSRLKDVESFLNDEK